MLLRSPRLGLCRPVHVLPPWLFPFELGPLFPEAPSFAFSDEPAQTLSPYGNGSFPFSAVLSLPYGSLRYAVKIYRNSPTGVNFERVCRQHRNLHRWPTIERSLFYDQ